MIEDKREPLRTCIGCRAKVGTATLVRVVVGADGRLVLDRKGAGRGAWLCRQVETGSARPACVAAAKKRGAFARALRAKVGPAEVEALLSGRTGES